MIESILLSVLSLKATVLGMSKITMVELIFFKLLLSYLNESYALTIVIFITIIFLLTSNMASD